MEYENKIAGTKNLKNAHVWLYSGTLDTEVYQLAVDKVYEFYKNFGTTDIKYVNKNNSIHQFPTTDRYAPKTCIGREKNSYGF